MTCNDYENFKEFFNKPDVCKSSETNHTISSGPFDLGFWREVEER